MKTNELTGAQLNWAVAKCEAFECRLSGTTMIFDGTEVGDDDEIRYVHYVYSPSYSWAQGGPIIEREFIECTLVAYEQANEYSTVTTWLAQVLPTNDDLFEATGPTLLVAAMRCYVASKLGNEIEVPEALMTL